MNNVKKVVSILKLSRSGISNRTIMTYQLPNELVILSFINKRFLYYLTKYGLIDKDLDEIDDEDQSSYSNDEN